MAKAQFLVGNTVTIEGRFPSRGFPKYSVTKVTERYVQLGDGSKWRKDGKPFKKGPMSFQLVELVHWDKRHAYQNELCRLKGSLIVLSQLNLHDLERIQGNLQLLLSKVKTLRETYNDKS